MVNKIRNLSAIQQHAQKLKLKFYSEVYQINPNTYEIINIFKNCKEAANFLYTDSSGISKVCRNELNSYKGFYWCYAKNYCKNWKPTPTKHKVCIDKIYCFELNKTFDTVKDAANYFNCKPKSIIDCCEKKQFQMDNYHFCYVKDKSNFHIENDLKSVICLDTLKIYDSAEELAQEINGTASNIRSVCSHHMKTYKGYVFMYYDEYLINPKIIENKKIVAQYSLDGKFLKTFSSAQEASRQLFNTDKQGNNISNAIRKQQSSNGFYWSHQILPYFKPKRKYANTKTIYQYNIETGEYINQFDSCPEAGEKIGIGRKNNISSACLGTQKTCGGYKWSYIKADNYNDIPK